ncbi:alpha/beta fold hydrolase [Neoroseomonas rubea]|uniref:alpha/beta fold hydrolase n=1 Tax=Neoroseomonas rubea TaxID=2748666 RepID=UPI0018DF658E|nr:alpha/beta hydrolase [Roseomonas rubea]
MTRQTLTADGIRQSYLQYGAPDLPALLLPPGITSPAQTWAFVGERLGVRYRTIIPDLRGRGLSEGGAHLAYDLDSYAADIEALVATIGLLAPALMGHSMGARIAIRLARQGICEVVRAVLIDPPMSGPGRRLYPTDLSCFLDSLALAHQSTDPSVLKPFVPGWSEKHLRTRLEWLRRCDRHAVIASHAGFHTEDIHADLPHLTLPTRLVIAGRGGVVSEEDVAEIGALNARIELRTVIGAGHMSPWEDEQGFVEALEGFL